MRSALLLATLTLSTFAIPISQPSDDSLNIHGCWRSGTRRDEQIDARSPTPTPKACKISHPRDVEGDQSIEFTLEARNPGKIGERSPSLSRPKGSQGYGKVRGRAIRNEGLSHGTKPKNSNGKREPIYRPNGRREVEEEEEDDVEVRAIRSESNKRDAEPEPVVRPTKDWKRAEEDVEARGAIRNESNKRDAEPEPVVRPTKDWKRAEEDVEARGAIRNESNKRSEDDIEARGAIRNDSNKRDAEAEAGDDGLDERAAEAEPITRKHDSYRRTAEAEPITRKHDSYRQSAEAEPIGRAGAGRRSPKGTVRPSNKRNADPAVRPANKRTAEAEPINRIHG